MSKRSTLWLDQLAVAMKQHGAVFASRKLTRANGSVEEIQLQLAPSTCLPADVRTLSAGGPVSPTVVQVMEDEADAGEEVAATPEEVALAAKRRRYENLFPGISDKDLADLPEFP